MWKGFLGVLTILVVFGSISYSAIESILIDFPQYEQNWAKIVEKDKSIHDEVIKTKPEMDLSQFGYPSIEFTIDDWKMDQWRVILTSSANTVENNVLSYCKKVNSKRWGEVLGVRIHFPSWSFLSWAKVAPPYDFFVYYDDGSYVNKAEGGGENSLVMGVLANVGQIKSISAWVYGLNYPHQIGLRLKDRDENVQEYFLGNTFYDGWRNLVWINPEYTEDIRNKILGRLPLYPKSYPYVKFDSYVVYKPEINNGGDYVVYFKDVVIQYSRAIVREELDIEDEEWWGILSEETLQRKIQELKKIGEEAYLKKQEIKRMEAATSTE